MKASWKKTDSLFRNLWPRDVEGAAVSSVVKIGRADNIMGRTGFLTKPSAWVAAGCTSAESLDVARIWSVEIYRIVLRILVKPWKTCSTNFSKLFNWSIKDAFGPSPYLLMGNVQEAKSSIKEITPTCFVSSGASSSVVGGCEARNSLLSLVEILGTSTSSVQ